MKKTIAIITSDPASVNYEIIRKSIFFFNKKNKNNYLFIGSKKLFYKNIDTKKKIIIENINWNGYKKKSNYLKKSFKKFFELYRTNKVHGLINLPLNKKDFLKNSYPGVTEYIADMYGCLGKESMLLYSSIFSVCPLTTHIKIKNVSKQINIKKIINSYNNIVKFYKNIVKISQPKIGILGLNPHNSVDFFQNSEEEKIIIPAIKKLKKNTNSRIIGPISPDVSFMEREKENINSLIGLYHDQVLSTFKYINKFSGINITLGLPFIRMSPDHGTGINIKGKNKANPESFLYCLNFFERYYKSL